MWMSRGRYYSLSDNNVAEMLDLLRSAETPPEKKARACVLLADLAAQSQEMRNVITEAGGVKALVAVLKGVTDSELARSAALVLTQLCTSDRVASAVAAEGGCVDAASSPRAGWHVLGRRHAQRWRCLCASCATAPACVLVALPPRLRSVTRCPAQRGSG